MRASYFLAIGLMALCPAAYLMPTFSGAIGADSIAFQRTDIAAVVVGLSWLSIAITVLGVSRAGMATAFVAGLAALASQPLIASNPRLGELAHILHMVAPALALAFAAARFALRAKYETASKPADPPAPAAAPPAPSSAPRRAAVAAGESHDLFRGPQAGGGSTGTANVARWAPDDRERLQLMEMRLADAERTEDAISILEEIVERFPTYGPAKIKLAGILFAENETERALEHLERALARGSDDVRAVRMAARCAMTLGDWKKAASYWERLLDVAGPSVESVVALVSCHAKAGDADQALALYDRHSGAWPDNSRLVAAAALAAQSTEDYDKAAALWIQASRLDDGPRQYKHQAFRSLCAAGRPQDALEHILAVHNADDPVPGSLLCALVTETPRLDHDFVMEALGATPSTTREPWIRYIERCVSTDHFDRAAEALAASPDWGVMDEAVEALEVVINRTREDHGAAAEATQTAEEFLTRAAAFERKEMWNRALQVYKACERAHGPNEDLALRVTPVLRRLARHDDAKALAAAALSAFGESAALTAESGWTHADAGETAEAEAAWRRALDKNRDCPGAWIGLIRAQLSRKREDSASELLRQALDAVADQDEILREPDLQSLNDRTATAARQ